MNSDRSSTHMTFFKDKNGHIVLWQWPNIPIYGWIIFKLLAMLFAHTHLKLGCEQVGTAFLFVWAYLELAQGVNYFRKLLGLIFLVMIIASYFK